MHESASKTARVHASGGSLRWRRNKGRTCSGQEMQFLVLATRGQEVTASELEDGPAGYWLVVAVDGTRERVGVQVDVERASGDPLVTDT